MTYNEVAAIDAKTLAEYDKKEMTEAIRTVLARIDNTNINTPIKDMRETWEILRAALVPWQKL